MANDKITKKGEVPVVSQIADSQSTPWTLILGVIAVISCFINVIQFLFNRSKERRLRKYEKIDYGSHLQLLDENVAVLWESIGHALNYSGKLENCGSKTASISRISLEYGSGSDRNKRYKLLVEREFYLKPGEQKVLIKSLLSNEIEKAKREFQLEDCFFSIRVDFLDPLGESKYKELPLVSIGKRGAIMDVRGGIIA